MLDAFNFIKDSDSLVKSAFTSSISIIHLKNFTKMLQVIISFKDMASKGMMTGSILPMSQVSPHSALMWDTMKGLLTLRCMSAGRPGEGTLHLVQRPPHRHTSGPPWRWSGVSKRTEPQVRSKGPRVHGSKGPRVQGSKGPRVQGFRGPRVQGWAEKPVGNGEAELVDDVVCVCLIMKKNM